MFRFFSKSAEKKSKGYYSTIALSPDQIRDESYKQYLGGGEQNWKSRGEFQLFLLKKMGLLPEHRMLDIGCGPIRGGAHLIRYLASGMYCGVDYNVDFIRAAEGIVEEHPDLKAKNPTIFAADDFGFSQTTGTFDYLLAFSVFNHCNAGQIATFFCDLPHKLKSSSKVHITHAFWFKPQMLSSTELTITRTLSGPEAISPGLNMKDWGWPPEESIFPILELALKAR